MNPIELRAILALGAEPKSVSHITKETGYPDKEIRNAIDAARVEQAIWHEPRGFWRTNDPVPSPGPNRWKRQFSG